MPHPQDCLLSCTLFENMSCHRFLFPSLVCLHISFCCTVASIGQLTHAFDNLPLLVYQVLLHGCGSQFQSIMGLILSRSVLCCDKGRVSPYKASCKVSDIQVYCVLNMVARYSNCTALQLGLVERSNCSRIAV